MPNEWGDQEGGGVATANEFGDRPAPAAAPKPTNEWGDAAVASSQPAYRHENVQAELQRRGLGATAAAPAAGASAPQNVPGLPELAQFDDSQLAALAVHQGLLQPEDAERAIVAKKQQERAPVAAAVEGAMASNPMAPVPPAVARLMLEGGGRVGDTAANVLAPLGGAAAGTAAAGPAGTIAGGAGGGLVGDALVQARQYFRGERDELSKGELTAATIAGGVPMGGRLLKTPARVIAIRALQGAGIAAGSQAVGQLIDKGHVDLSSLAATGMLGAVMGGGFGAVESAATRRLVLRAIRQTPEFGNFAGSDAELVAEVRARMAARQATEAEPINVTGTAVPEPSAATGGEPVPPASPAVAPSEPVPAGEIPGNLAPGEVPARDVAIPPAPETAERGPWNTAPGQAVPFDLKDVPLGGNQTSDAPQAPNEWGDVPAPSAPTNSAPNTPAFPEWFGGSHVVDAGGTPQVVFHGTRTPGFADFSGPAYFTSDPDVAQHYLHWSDTGAIYPAYLNVKQPLEVKSVAELAQRVPAAAAHVDLRNDSLFEALDRPAIREAIQAAGFDGVKFIDLSPDTMANHESWLVFKPEQIRSAIGARASAEPTPAPSGAGFEPAAPSPRAALRAGQESSAAEVTPGEKVVAPAATTEAAVSKLAAPKQLRVQKEFLAREVTKAAAAAPSNLEFVADMAELAKQAKRGNKTTLLSPDQQAAFDAKYSDFITIHVPDDGTYRIHNIKEALQSFAAKVDRAFGRNLKSPEPVQRMAPKLTPDELAQHRVKAPGTTATGRPLQGRADALPAIPAAAVPGAHPGPMSVAMERMLPGAVDVPTVMESLERVVSVLGRASPIRTGRFYQQALGVFKNFADTIRLRQGDDIPTAAHEVAHAVARALFGNTKGATLIAALRAGAVPTGGGSSPLLMKVSPTARPTPAAVAAIVAELHALGKALYGARVPNAGYVGEGFAELIRLWLTTEHAARRAPAAMAWLEKTLLAPETALGGAMRAARDKIDLWRGQGAEGRAAAQMKEPPGRLQKLREFVRDNLGRQAQVEEFSPLEELANGFAKVSGRELPANENPYLLASAFRKTAGVTLETMVDRGMVDLWGNITGPSLKEALTRIQPEQSQPFAHYLWSRRAIERWAKGKNPGMALADAQYLKQKLETPAFIDAATKYYAWWDGVLEYLKQASPATNAPIVDAIRAGSYDYVPLARALDPAKVKAAAAASEGGGVYKMHGSGLPIKNIYLQSLLVAERMVARAHRDIVLNSILNISHHEGMGWLVERVPLARVMESVNIEKIRRELESYGVDTSSIPDDTIVKYATHLDAPTGSDPIVPRKTATGTEWYQIPAKVYELLNGIETPARLGWAFELFLGAPARMFKLGTTGVRASFSLVTNPARDFPTFMMQSLAGNPASRAAAWATAMRDIVVSALGGKESPTWELYHQLGIATSNFLGGDIRQAQREAKSLFRGRIYRRMVSPIETLREALSFSESGPRLAELALMARELGWKPGQPLTPVQATVLRIAAKRVTTDFSSAGRVGREINRAIPFYNANIQGARGFARGFQKDQDVKRKSAAAFKAVMNGLMLLTLPALFNWWKYKDEDWYRMLPWRERYLYLNVPWRGNIVQVPMPQEWGSAFATLPLAAFDSWYRKDPEALKQAVGHIFDLANPVAWPTLAAAAKEQWQNNVNFFNRPIVPRGEVDLMPGSQRSYYSSWVATTLGDVFPGQISPRRFDAAVREIFGGAGNDLVDAPTSLMRALGMRVQERDTEAADMPVVGRLFRRGGEFSAANQPLVDFWDDYDRYSALLASQEHNQRAAAMGKRPPPAPVPFKDQAYAARLNAAFPAIRMVLEMASRTPEEDKRQELYRRAAAQAKRITAARPKE